MQKIAIFGGTFNPIHNGHVHLAQQFSARIGFDRVIFIPTHVPPHKQAPELASAQHRLCMCRLAAQEYGYEVSDIEVNRAGPSYTADTLQQLKLLYPQEKLYLITGEDMFLTLNNWRNPQQIYELATICAAPRSELGYEKLAAYAKELEQFGAHSIIENIEYLPVSSTMVRTAIKNGESIAHLVPHSVADYIEKNKLYME
ncbi:MAG TPA: nicotinate-nucleotide adenylyltransferase [Oscillospiraceae bacterium]|nr:nicotinate-nucleotide adenylyltransferase [Oscillospiraceae bacterium]